MTKYKLNSFTELGEVEFKKVSDLELTFPCYIVTEEFNDTPQRFNPDWFNYEEVDNFPTTLFRIEPPVNLIPESYMQNPWGPKYKKKVNKYKYTR